MSERSPLRGTIIERDEFDDSELNNFKMLGRNNDYATRAEAPTGALRSAHSEAESYRTNEDPRANGTADIRKELPALKFEIQNKRLAEEEKDLDPKLDEVAQVLLREPIKSSSPLENSSRTPNQSRNVSPRPNDSHFRALPIQEMV